MDALTVNKNCNLSSFPTSDFRGAVINFLLAKRGLGWTEGKFFTNMDTNDIFDVFNESIVILFNKSVTNIEVLLVLELVFTSPKIFLFPFCFSRRKVLFIVSDTRILAFLKLALCGWAFW